MRKLTLIVFTALILGTSFSFAQKVEAGVFLDFLSVTQTSTNNFGLGARFGYRIHRDVMLEGELAYDYGINFDEAYLQHCQRKYHRNRTHFHRRDARFIRPETSARRRRIPSLRNFQSRFDGLPA